jgi:anti-sigma factor RsiW
MNLMERSFYDRSGMDHRYIDQYAVAERYLDHGLSPDERAAFEQHLVDCQECTDRVLLAEMFHARQPNGVPARSPSAPQSTLVLRLKPWQLALLAIIALLALAIPAFVIPAFLH